MGNRPHDPGEEVDARADMEAVFQCHYQGIVAQRALGLYPYLMDPALYCRRQTTCGRKFS